MTVGIGDRLRALRQIGTTVPARPAPPFDEVPANPNAEQSNADAEFQASCAAWIEAIDCLYAAHFPRG